MVLSAQDIRSRVMTALTDNLPSGWRRSNGVLLHALLDPATARHRSWQVMVPDTNVLDEAKTNTSPDGTLSAYAETIVQVRWVWRLKVDGANDSYQAALGSEDTVWTAIEAIDETGISAFNPIRIQRRGVQIGDGQEWVTTLIEFGLRHLTRV
jgi:hypothetical protein